MIEKSVIWDEVQIGPGSNVEELITCNNCEIGANALLRSAIIPPFCKVDNNTQVIDETLEMG